VVRLGFFFTVVGGLVIGLREGFASAFPITELANFLTRAGIRFAVSIILSVNVDDSFWDGFVGIVISLRAFGIGVECKYYICTPIHGQKSQCRCFGAER
jgi:hypothetical protein